MSRKVDSPYISKIYSQFYRNSNERGLKVKTVHPISNNVNSVLQLTASTYKHQLETMIKWRVNDSLKLYLGLGYSLDGWTSQVGCKLGGIGIMIPITMVESEVPD